MNAALVEESAEDLYENAPCGYLSTLPDGTILKVNRTFLTWTGYEREELLAGKRFQDLLAIGSKIFHETHYAPLLRMQGFLNEINFELMRKDRQKIPVLINTTQRRDAAGNPLLNRTTVFDISDRKKYEQELLLARKKAEQSTKAKADFLSMISHEIRTPMNAIIGISNLLNETQLSSEQEEYVRILRFSSENLLSLLNDILDFSKIEAGKVTLEERSFDIRQLIYSIVYSIGIKAEEKNLRVQVEVSEQVPARLIGDPIKIGQILTNLLSNAIKFTERGGVSVTLRVRELSLDAAALEFKVIDTGIGIAEDRLGPIFEEFTQASYDINVKYGGTGLGLAITRKLLELYGSKMSVESVPGEGSSFSFDLRLKIGQELENPEGPAAVVPDEQTLRGVKVLVAEDHEVNVFVIERFLRKWGVEFEVVENGQRAVEKVTTNHYDLVLMDLQMPELDGYDATRKIRSLPEEKFRRLPIIALTASSRIGMEDRLAHSGFTDVIVKPFKLEELFAKIAEHGSRSVPVSAGRRPVRAREVLDSAPPSRSFSIEGFRELADGDRTALVELLSINLSSCERYKQGFQDALEAGNPEQFEVHAHKITMTLSLLQAHALRAALQQAHALLAEKERDPARLQSVGHVIQRELDAIIEVFKMELENG